MFLRAKSIVNVPYRRGLSPLFIRCLSTSKPWLNEMSRERYDFMKWILEAPSPVGLEYAMTRGIVDKLNIPSGWKVHNFKGNAGIVIDTKPNCTDELTCMIMGHADKIRLQVRKIGNDGKVFIDSDSHLPLSLLGNQVAIYSEDAENPGKFRVIRGGTVEALGAIHFADASLRTGTKGIKPEQLYVELQLHGEKRKEQVTKGLGLRPGDSILMDRPIGRGVGQGTIVGPYLDNGLGSFVTADVAALVAQTAFDKLPRVLFAISSHEEIGRFGSRVICQELKPDVLIAVDVNHDYNAAPGVGDKNFPEIEMGGGPTVSVGSVASNYLNACLQVAAKNIECPIQMDCVGRDTGTDAMASVLGNIDCATASVGIPIRNMHTCSECACTQDVTACSHLLLETLKVLGRNKRKDFHVHPDLSQAQEIWGIPEEYNGEDKEHNEE